MNDADQQPAVVPTAAMNSIAIEDLTQALLSLDRLTAKTLLTQSAESLMVPALEQIGAGWERGEVALSQVYMASRICEDIINQTFPSQITAAAQPPRIAIAVLEDFHQLGKRIVSSVLRSNGITLLDYGTLKADELIQRTLADHIEILLISTLMLPSALKIKLVTAGLAAAGAQVKVIVGGAPFRFDDQLWQEVGAYAMGKNASDALAILRDMSSENYHGNKDCREGGAQ